MSHLDQYESVFKSAAKELYEFEAVPIGSILVVTDLLAAEAQALTDDVRQFLRVLDRDGVVWTPVAGEQFRHVQQLLDLVEEAKPDLLVTYRHLHSDAWRWPHSLGEYVDVLTQVGSPPVLVLPHPAADRALPHTCENTDRVMAITDHLTGDHRLVNFAIAFTEAQGSCYLTHVEDGCAFDRFMGVIEKIPSIDTESAREAILQKLLKEPTDYVHSCQETLEAKGLPVKIEPMVDIGHRLTHYQELVTDHDVDLLIMNTKDEDQLAMHGLAYPLAVELRTIPLLLL